MDRFDLADELKTMHGFYGIHEGFKGISLDIVPKSFSEETESRVDRIWNELLREGKVKYSTEIVGIEPEKYHLQGEELAIGAYATDFKHYRCMLGDADNSERTWLTGAAGIVKLKHKGSIFYLFGERNSGNMKAGGDIESLPGGFLDVKFLDTSNPYRSALEGELKDELGISGEEVTRVTPMRSGLLRRDRRGKEVYNLCLDFLMEINDLSPDQVLHRFKETNKEHSNLFITEDLMEFISKNKNRLSERTLFTMEHVLRNGL